MSINVTFEQGTGFAPRIVRIVTTDSLATVTAAGWLNSVVNEGIIILPTDQLLISYSTNVNFFTQSVSNGIYTVALSEGNVLLPTIANHIAVYTNTTGGLTEDVATAINGGNIQAGLSATAGYLASFPSAGLKGSLRIVAVANTGDTLVTLSNALHGQASVYSIPDSGASTANILISKLTGTQHITVGSLQVDAGVISSGISTGGQVGSFAAFPTTASKGSLRLTALVNATGDFSTTISNALAVAQSQVISIPDVGAATGNFILSGLAGGGTQHVVLGNIGVDAGLLISGLSTGGAVGTLQLFPTTTTTGSIRWLAAVNAGAFNVDFTNASHAQSTVYTIPDIGAATGGVVVATTAIKMKSVAGASAAGGAAAQSFTDTFSTTGSNIVGNWNTQANAASVLKIVPGNGSFVVTSSADAGVGTFNYIITK